MAMTKASSSAAAMQVPAALLLVLLVGLSWSSCSSAQSTSCGPTSELAPCLPAAEADVQPTTECCTALTSYLTGDPETCLCQAASSSSFESSGAAVQYAVTIPEKCNLTYKAGTVCNGVTIPGGQ